MPMPGYRKAVMKRKAHLQQKEIAEERVEILLKQIEANPTGEFTPHYISLIEKLCRRWKLKFPSALVDRYCQACQTYFVPGTNSSIRIVDKKPLVVCRCGSEWPAKQRLFKH